MPFRFGLIGAGAVSETHVLAMRMIPDIQLIAVADVDLSRAKALAQRYNIPQVYDTVDALLASAPVDAVSVVTPHGHHLPAARAAAKAKKHALVEKAMADSVASADEMIDICRANGVTLGGILQNRFTAAARSLKESVRSGLLGRIFLASITVKLCRSAEYYRRGPWRGRKAEGGGGDSDK